jgi:16S rRNA (cytidine1402-2'-O)-methyltransferase
MPGTLYLVATPIGHLDDISARALRVLGEVAAVAAEDTRRTLNLLRHFGLQTPLLSLHEHNEHERTPALVARLLAGESVALVSDAGTPLVSDPGAALVRTAIDAGIRVEAIPGPSAVLAALAVSGLASPAGFTVAGFPPSRAEARRRWLQALAAEPRPVVLFEAPHRVRQTLDDIAALLGDRRVAVARELTKVHEEVLRGRASEVAASLGEPRGEFTLVMAPDDSADRDDVPVLRPGDAWREFEALTASGSGRREAIATLARRYGRSTRDIYAVIEQGKPGRS